MKDLFLQKRKILSATLFALVIIVASFMPTKEALALIPFGGPITSIFPCVNGLWITEGPPVPISLMYAPGSFSFAYGPPRHPGQYLLGMAGPVIPCLVPCHTGLCVVGAGAMIIFHGASV